uniref:Origin recognition complex subunit 6 n=1 Tax=Syphacia muris TaxID=451379 RepID=A0A158R577_9BILA
MEDVLGYPEAAKKPYDVDAYIKQLLIANSFENASKVLSACARNAKLWSSGSGTVASLNLLAVRYNCSTSEISSVVYALVRLCEIAGSKQVDGDEIESKLCVYGFDDSVAHDIVSFVCGQQSLESLTVCRSHAPVFSPYPRFRSLTARTEIKNLVFETWNSGSAEFVSKH